MDPFCGHPVAYDVVGAVVADSLRAHSNAVAVDDGPVVVAHDDFDLVVSDDAALLVADDGMEVVDGSLDLRPVGSSRAVGRRSFRGCYAAVYPDDTAGDDLVAGSGAVEASSLRDRIGSVDAGVAAAAAVGEVDSELDQALASASSALPVVVPCSDVVAAAVVVDTVAGDADDVFRCRRRGHLRPLMRHCWGHPCQRLVVLQAAMVRSPVGVQLAAELALVPPR